MTDKAQEWREEAMQAYIERQSQDTKGGCGEPVGFIAGYLEARKKAQRESDKLRAEIERLKGLDKVLEKLLKEANESYVDYNPDWQKSVRDYFKEKEGTKC